MDNTEHIYMHIFKVFNSLIRHAKTDIVTEIEEKLKENNTHSSIDGLGYTTLHPSARLHRQMSTCNTGRRTNKREERKVDTPSLCKLTGEGQVLVLTNPPKFGSTSTFSFSINSSRQASTCCRVTLCLC